MSSFLLGLMGGPHWQVLNSASFVWNFGTTNLVGTPSGFARKYGFDDNKTVSDSLPTLITPAGFAFIIWGPIFGLETAFTLWQQTSNLEGSPLQHAAPFWQLACVLQGFWGIFFGKRYIGTSALLLSGIAMALGQYHSRIVDEMLPMEWMTKVGFSMHFSWAVAAALVNWNLFLKASNAPQNVREISAYASLLAAGVFGVTTAVATGDAVISAVSAWALFAISRKQKFAKELKVSQTSVAVVNALSSGLAALCAATSLYVLLA